MSDRSEATPTAAESREELALRILQRLPAIVYVFDLAAGVNRYSSEAWAESFGYGPDETRALGATLLPSLLHPDDAAHVAAHHAALRDQAHDGVAHVRYRLRRGSGEYAWLESDDRPFARDGEGRVTQILGVARDVTAEVEHEHQHAASEQRFRAMVEGLPDAVFIAATDGRLLEVNRAACAQVGRTREELLAVRVPELLPERLRQQFVERLREPRAGEFRESVHVRGDGGEVPVEVAVVPLQIDGRPAMLSVARDITTRHAAEARTAAETALRAAVVEQAIEGVCVCEEIPEAPGLRFSVWNARMTEICGYDLAEINRLGWYQTVYTDAETQARAADRMARMRTGEDLAAEEWVITRKDGQRRTLLISTRVLAAPGMTPRVLGVMHDVTERKRMQQQLADAQRLESIGRLAGAVAHDFNNLLTAILGGATLLEVDRALPDAQRAAVGEIVTAARRGGELTRQLLTVSRRQRSEPRALDLGAQLDESLRVIRRLLGDRIEVRASFEAGCRVLADPGMLDQVLMNLSVNARDAMDGRGVLSIEVRPAPGPDGRPGAELVVADIGAGIAPQDLPHVFEPFFTTKPEGQGTGLGLATVYGIVTHHGGTIDVESERGRGTAFRLWFPRTDAPPHEEPTREVESPVRGRRVLVVDDQPAVRRVTARLVEHLGHVPIEARDPAEALALAGDHAGDIDLLLTDVSLAAGESGVA
ncbi:MAG: PAS domain S-box protein, partial [Deltaproteobacteria bacterium]|nr:PAS domain S-box protein [Deltaproteobacteria bacterium]